MWSRLGTAEGRCVEWRVACLWQRSNRVRSMACLLVVAGGHAWPSASLFLGRDSGGARRFAGMGISGFRGSMSLSQHNTTTLCLPGSFATGVTKARTTTDGFQTTISICKACARSNLRLTSHAKFDLTRTRPKQRALSHPQYPSPDTTPTGKMGRAEAGSTKAISNQLKSKGLTRLRWYCQVCEKACRDANAFKYVTAHPSTRSPLLATNPDANDGLGCTACPSRMSETWS